MRRRLHIFLISTISWVVALVGEALFLRALFPMAIAAGVLLIIINFLVLGPFFIVDALLLRPLLIQKRMLVTLFLVEYLLMILSKGFTLFQTFARYPAGAPKFFVTSNMPECLIIIIIYGSASYRLFKTTA